MSLYTVLINRGSSNVAIEKDLLYEGKLELEYDKHSKKIFENVKSWRIPCYLQCGLSTRSIDCCLLNITHRTGHGYFFEGGLSR